MGCDIHPKAEVFIGGKWMRCEDDYACVPRDRNYATFGILAGVRDEDVPAIAAPRGLPADTAWEHGEDRPGGMWFGDHSHSWVTLREMRDAWDALSLEQRSGAWLLKKLIEHLEEYAYTVPAEHIRLVFGFDS